MQLRLGIPGGQYFCKDPIREEECDKRTPAYPIHLKSFDLTIEQTNLG